MTLSVCLPETLLVTPRLKLLNLFPEDIGAERTKRILDPLPRGGILRDRPLGRPAARQESRLAADEEARDAEERPGHDVAQRRRLQQRRHVRDGLLAAVGEADVRGLLGGADRSVEGFAVRAQTEGQESAQGDARERADQRVARRLRGRGADEGAVFFAQAADETLEERPEQGERERAREREGRGRGRLTRV